MKRATRIELSKKADAFEAKLQASKTQDQLLKDALTKAQEENEKTFWPHGEKK